jgi:NADH-quinone oxidoreductase subunit N
LGSPTAITCFLATIVKFGIYCTFIRSYYTVILDFFNESTEFKNLLIILSLSSVIVGAIGAIDQFKIKRFIGFTTINQMGFIMLGLCTQTMYGFVASYLYLCIYIILNLIFFLFILNIRNRKGEEVVYMSDLVPFFNINKMAGFVFIILLFSLAGMPPTIGFYMKLLVLKSLIVCGYVKLTVVLLYINVVSIFYYVRIIKIVFFDVESLVFFSVKEVSEDHVKNKYRSFSLLPSPFFKVENINSIFKDSKLI